MKNRLLTKLFAMLLFCSAQLLLAQEPQQKDPLPQVDLSAMEQEVSQQLREARQRVEHIAANPGTDSDSLIDAYVTLGRLYHAYGLLQAAEACYSRAGKLQPQHPQWPYLYAVVNELQGDDREAITALQHLLRYHPDDLPARMRLARLYRMSGEFGSAAQILTELQQQYPATPAVEAELGELALAEGNNTAAVHHLQQALIKVPEATRLYYPLAIAYRNLGETTLARETMAKRGDVGISVNEPLLSAIEELKSGERLQLLRGKLAFNAGDYQAAAAAFDKAVTARPESARAHINLATALSQLGELETALAHLLKALELEPDNAVAHFNVSAIAMRRGDIDSALTHLKRVVELSPRDVAARLQFASLLLKKGEPGEAFEQYKAIVKIAPTTLEAWMNSANLLVAARQYAEAKMVLEQGHRALPHETRISHALARLLAASPDLTIRDAEKSLPLAQQLYQARPSLHHAYTLSLAMAESGECSEAARFLEHSWGQLNKEEQNHYQARVKESLDYYQTHSPCRKAPVW